MSDDTYEVEIPKSRGSGTITLRFERKNYLKEEFGGERNE